VGGEKIEGGGEAIEHTLKKLAGLHWGSMCGEKLQARGREFHIEIESKKRISQPKEKAL